MFRINICPVLFLIYFINFYNNSVVTQKFPNYGNSMEEEDCRLHIEQGVLFGKTDIDWLGGKFCSFQGIPYAKPPVGDLRFKAPEPANKWEGTLNATAPAPECSQKIFNRFHGQEDCLYLNVYTKKLNQNQTTSLTNVLLWLHGGYFQAGSGNDYGPHLLIAENVVIVTINYRLGTFGFLSFHDSSLGISGNAGLKDQRIALKWIEKNIIYFGGDKFKITVAGIDAGAASAEYLLTTAKPRGLIQRLILHSGSLSAYWARGRPFSIELAKLLATVPNFITEKDAYSIIRNQSTFDILQAHSILMPENSGEIIVGPIIEPIYASNAILTRDPHELISGNNYLSQVPILTGYTSMEGLNSILLYKQNPSSYPNSVKDLERLLPWDMNLVPGGNFSNHIAQKVRDFYYGNDSVTDKNLYKTLKFQGDRLTVYPMYKEVKLLTDKSSRPVYVYKFSIETEMNKFKQKYNLLNFEGAAHSDEIGYLFSYKNAPKIEPGSNIEHYIRIMTKFWGNFIRLGNPNDLTVDDTLWNVSWLPVADHFNYLNIRNNGLELDVDPENVSMRFWDELYREVLEQSLEADIIINNVTFVEHSSCPKLEFKIVVLILSVISSYIF